MSDTLRVAVIGCGRIAEHYKMAFQNIGSGFQLVLCCDKVPDRAKAFAAVFPGCQAVSETNPSAFAALCKEKRADILHILLPHFLHCRYAVAALDAGINVLTEKPIGISMEDAYEMEAARDRSGKQLGVIFQNRLIDGVQRVRSLMESGELGEVRGAFSTLNWFRPPSYYRCDWKGKWATEGGGVIIDQAIHSIDLVRYMTGLEAVKIQGHTARRVLDMIEVEDEADAAITLSNGAIYSFFATNYYITNSPIRVEITYENAAVLLTYNRMEITWKDGRKEEILPVSAASETAGVGYWGAFHEKQIRMVYDALRRGENILWTAEDAAKTLEIVLGIYESSRINGPVIL